MGVAERLDRRWSSEVVELGQLADGSSGAFRVLHADSVRVRAEVSCASAFWEPGTGSIVVRDAVHRLAFSRSSEWPAEAVTARHEHPPGVVHPNVMPGKEQARAAGPAGSPAARLAGALFPGAICYGHAGPGIRLTDVVVQIIRILRYETYAKRGMHLNAEASRWVQLMLAEDPEFFPLGSPVFQATEVARGR